MAVHIIPSHRAQYQRPVMWPIGRSGIVPTASNTGPSIAALSANQIVAQPVYIQRRIWVTGLAIDPGFSHATAKVSLAVYNDSSGAPGSRAIQGGETGITTTNLKIVSVTGQWLNPGHYWTAWNTDTANSGFNGSPSCSQIPLLGKTNLSDTTYAQTWFKSLTLSPSLMLLIFRPVPYFLHLNPRA